MEQYGHMEEVYTSPEKKKSLFGRIVKAIFLVLFVCVLGFLFFRMCEMDAYPDNMTELSFDGALLSHYEEVGTSMKVYTQKIRLGQDDSRNGYFFSDYLFLVPDARQMQVTLRFNRSTVDKLESAHALENLNADSFIYRLEDSLGNTYVLSDVQKAQEGKYHFRKLTFNDVDFPLPSEVVIKTDENGQQTGGYYALVAVYLEGVDDPVARIPIYETHVSAKDREKKDVLCVYDVEPYDVEEWPTND